MFDLKDIYSLCNKLDNSKCSKTCDFNGKYRSYSHVAELTIMNIQREIKRVAERHINLINEYPKQAAHLCTSDHINGTTLNHKRHVLDMTFLGNICRQLPSNKNQHNITIILHSDGAPVVDVSSKYHVKSAEYFSVLIFFRNVKIILTNLLTLLF